MRLRRGSHQVRVAARDQLLGELDDRHARAERVVDGRQLEADDPAADHQQALGDVGERERSVESITRGSS